MSPTSLDSSGQVFAMQPETGAKSVARKKNVGHTHVKATSERSNVTYEHNGIRSIGRIIVLSPQSREERAYLEEFNHKNRVFIRRFVLLGGPSKFVISNMIHASIRYLRLTEDLYRNAIVTQGRPNADQLLRRIATDVLKQIQSLKYQPVKSTTSSGPGRAKTSGYGGYLNDCCQECSTYLFSECYSQHVTNLRVPRTDKICRKCYAKLPLASQNIYHKYLYKHGYEPQGAGWNPNKH